MNLGGELLRYLGWNVHLRRIGWGMRLRRTLTVATLMAGVGTAIGYAVATRDLTDEDRDVGADGEA